MFGINKKKEVGVAGTIPWSDQASRALEKAVAGAPVPKPLKGAMAKELTKAAEQHALEAGHSEVTPEDLMNGLLAKLPGKMKDKVASAIAQGPDGLKNLENELKNK